VAGERGARVMVPVVGSVQLGMEAGYLRRTRVAAAPLVLKGRFIPEGVSCGVGRSSGCLCCHRGCEYSSVSSDSAHPRPSAWSPSVTVCDCFGSLGVGKGWGRVGSWAGN
jgi:hypothetical protein